MGGRIGPGRHSKPLGRHQSEHLGDVRWVSPARSCELGACLDYSFVAYLLDQPIPKALIAFRLNHNHANLQ